MLKRLRPRLTFANVTSAVALFVALGGGAYAAATLPDNSVGSKQLRKAAVTPPKVAPKTIKLFKGQRGLQGLRGLRGFPGASGASLVMGNYADQLVTVPGTANTHNEFAPSGFNPTQNLSITEAEQPVANANVVVRDLAVRVGVAPGAAGETTKTRTVTLLNGVADLLHCTVAADERTCNSGSQTATVPAGAPIYLDEGTGSVDVAPTPSLGWAFRAMTP